MIFAGLLLLCGLVAVAIFMARAPIEADLSIRAATLLEASGESWAVATFQGRDATITGEALAQEARTKVRLALEGLPGVRSVRDATTLLPERRPFTFSAVRDGSTLRLEGYVPSEYALARIAAAVKTLPAGLTVTGLDRLVRARGAPAGDFSEVVAFALDQLAKLPSGRVMLSDDAFSIEGRTPDLATYEALQRTLHAPLPQGFRLVRFAVRPPVVSPFVWSAAREGNAVRVQGYVPSLLALQDMTAALRAAIPGAKVEDRTQLGDGAPSTELWLKAVQFAAAQLALLPAGRVALSDTAITLEGAAPSFPTYDALLAARRAPPDGFSVSRFAVEPPVARPFVWRLERRGAQVRVMGYAPSEDARRVASEAVKGLFQGAQVAEDVKVASGGPPAEAWVAAVNYALAQVIKLRQGEVSVTDTAVSLAGEAEDSTVFAALLAAGKAPPPGVAFDVSQVLPPVISPYVFAARSDEAGVTLSGFLPDTASHDAVRARLAALFPKAVVNDVSALGAGAPEGFLPAVEAALVGLARLESGELRLSDGQIRMSGVAFTPAAGSQIAADLKASVPRWFSVEVSAEAGPPGTPLGAAECQRTLDGLLAARALRFDGDGTHLAAEAGPLLDRLAFTAQRCPPLWLAAQAGTGEGASEVPAAEILAVRRAAVVAALVAAGVPPSRLAESVESPQAGRAAGGGLAIGVSEPPPGQ